MDLFLLPKTRGLPHGTPLANLKQPTKEGEKEGKNPSSLLVSLSDKQ
jgi:hypothetical protein